MGRMDAIVGRACWYCGRPAASIWRTTWDAPGEDWPMCDGCGGGVAARLGMRAGGRHADADTGDDEHGIDTRGLAGRWIVPEAILMMPNAELTRGHAAQESK